GVHFQQYAVLLHPVPTVGVLFLLNAAGGAGLVVAILKRDRAVRLLALVGGLALVIGALVSIALAMNGGIFGYQEPTFRAPVIVAIVAEIVAIPALCASLFAELRRGA
ncbi:MAG: hypothetical protein DLM64_10695, partial [Solirubrobacterales bacterium]